MYNINNLNGFLTTNEDNIIPISKLKEKKQEQIQKLQELNLFPFQKSKLYKKLTETFNNQKYDYYTLIEESKKHIQENSISKLKDNIIILVHPFYLYLHEDSKCKQSHKLLTKEHIKNSIQYIENLNRVLSKKEFRDYSIMFFEELDVYYQFSSSFLENKIIDNTILTMNNDGIILNNRNKNSKFQKQKKSLEQLSGKKLFFGGGYAASYLHNKQIKYQCLDNAINDIKQQYYPKNQKPQIYLIEDLIINSPIIGKSLFEHINTEFYKKEYSHNKILKLNDL